MATILAFSGSARRESLNKKLVLVAAEAARKAGADVTYIDLGDYPMPVYHGDLEAESGMPENGLKLRELFLSHNALLIASPENNGSVSSLLKNTIDWLSRSINDGKGKNSGLAPYAGKTALLLAASPGVAGGARGLPHLRQILARLGVNVIGTQVELGRAHEAFDEQGALNDTRMAASVASAATQLAEASRKLSG